MKRYVTAKEAATITGLAESTLATKRSRGKGPSFVKLSRRCVRYDLDALYDWMRARTVSNTSETIAA